MADKPDDKPSQGPLKPPHPPPGKKPGGVPKGPVPPRGQVPLPPSGAPKPPIPPQARPAMPPMTPPARPPFPGMPGMKSPAAPMPLPPAMESQFAGVEGMKSDLEQKVAELEKRLTEEREKVLLASLRSKEEEAVSAKVETSIKEIQDKLRRERREQELDEARRKAEARVTDMERRIAEEREAWVATLKGQLSQRDQSTQEMEVHFSTRLKDLEYRWAQEKSALENALRDREADITKLKHEGAMRSEQEKAFWEERFKTLASEKDKIERDLERAKDRFEQEKDHLSMDRQSLKEQAGKLESQMRFQEEQFRQRMTLEREQLERQIKDAQGDAVGYQKQLEVERGSSDRLKAMETRYASLSAQHEQANQRVHDLEAESTNRRKKYETEIEDLTRDLSRARNSVKEEVEKARAEAEVRVRTLQSRVDWYDANVKREYENARDRAQKEFDVVKLQLQAAQQEVERLKDAGLDGQDAETLRAQLEQLKSEYKQSQWELESRLKEATEQAESGHQRLAQSEQIRATLEQELKQRSLNLHFHESQSQQQKSEIDRLREKIEASKRELDLERERATHLQTQMDNYKGMLHEKGVKPTDELEAQIRERSEALEVARQNIARLTSQVLDAERKDELFREKERAFKQMLSSKEDLAAEFKNRASVLDKKFNDLKAEFDETHELAKNDRERLQAKNKEIDALKHQQQAEIEAIERQKQEQIAALMRQKDEELQQVRAEASSHPAVPVGPSPEMIEAQVRQQVELDYVDRLRQAETDSDAKVAQAKEEAKKEMDRLKWETETLKEELKRAREARGQLEREAQELLQQAEAHYREELQRQLEDTTKAPKQHKGIFTAIGHFLDTPIIDTNKKKEDREEPPAAA